MTDPMERLIADALDAAGIAYVTGEGGTNPSGLDFLLPELGVEIEVKRFHSPRIAEQTSRAENVIIAQGEAAVRWLARLITSPATSDLSGRKAVVPCVAMSAPDDPNPPSNMEHETP